MQDRIGKTLGRYEILKERQRNDLGQVFKATDTVSGRTVSLWLLSPALTRYDGALKRRLAPIVEQFSTLSHPHLPAVYGLDDIDGQLCITYEYIEGKSLQQLLQTRGKLPVEQAVEVVSDVAAALDALHQCGIVGADIRPSTILLTKDGQAVLTDPGLSYWVRWFTGANRAGTASMVYAAPEMSHGKKPTVQSAVYALGILLYELLTGRAPYQDADSTPVYSPQARSLKPPSVLRRGVSSELDDLLKRMLARTPQNRPSIAQTLAVLGHVDTTPRLSIPTQLVWAAGALVVLALVLLLGEQPVRLGDLFNPGRPRSIQIARSPGNGTYEITLPKGIRPGDTVDVRLAVHPAANIAVAELPAVPKAITVEPDSQDLFGGVDLCRRLWARLQVKNLEVVGAKTMSRLIHTSGAEWLWQVCCQADKVEQGEHPASIEIFVRKPTEQGHVEEVMLRDIRFQLQVGAQPGPFADTNWALVLIGVLMLGIMVTFVVQKQPRL